MVRFHMFVPFFSLVTFASFLPFPLRYRSPFFPCFPVVTLYVPQPFAQKILLSLTAFTVSHPPLFFHLFFSSCPDGDTHAFLMVWTRSQLFFLLTPVCFSPRSPPPLYNVFFNFGFPSQIVVSNLFFVFARFDGEVVSPLVFPT